jgi:hypothetical protein
MRRRGLQAAFKLFPGSCGSVASQSATARRSPSNPGPTTDPVALVDAQAMVGSFVPSRPAQPSNATSSGRTGCFCAGPVVVARRPSVGGQAHRGSTKFPTIPRTANGRPCDPKVVSCLGPCSKRHKLSHHAVRPREVASSGGRSSAPVRRREATVRLPAVAHERAQTFPPSSHLVEAEPPE